MRLGRVIVVPLASPETAVGLGTLAGMLAAGDAGLVVPVSITTPRTSARQAEQAQEAVDLAAAAAIEQGVQARGQVVKGRQVSTAVLDAVDEHDASLVMIGWQGRSTANNVFGQLIDSIMGRSTVPLAVVRSAAAVPSRVLLPLSDEHLLEGGDRGVTLAAAIAGRLRTATSSSLVLLRTGEARTPLPGHLTGMISSTLHMPGTVAQAAGEVGRSGDIVVTSVAPTGEGLRNATTHLAWATPDCWQLVAIDVGPPAEVDVVSAVKGAGMVIEPVSDPHEEEPYLVEVTVTVERDAEDPWTAVSNAVRLVGSVEGHVRHQDADGQLVNQGRVRIIAPDPGTALSAIMLELDDVRWGIGPAQINYRLLDRDEPDSPEA